MAATLFAAGLAQAAPPPVEKPATVRPQQAKPLQKPQSTSDRAKAGATGYVPESDEETQERPNPMSGQSVRRSAPMQAPDNMQQQTPVR